MFLEKILRQRRNRLEPSPQQQEEWQILARQAAPVRSFRRALKSGSGPRIIAEFKRASPSKGVLNPHLDPGRQARAYEDGGAVALSVLTEPDFFHGSAEDLRAARQATSLPVIRKDFLLEDWEIPQSRSWGADAILLIAAALPQPRLERMLQLADQFGLDALVEVHSPEEAHRVASLKPALVGINNRDLGSFQVDLNITRSILPLLPPDCVRVSESGFGTYQQLLGFPEVDAFLIGETLVRASDPTGCLRQLLGMPAAEIGEKES